ncbi:hypothetical protein E2C01_068668 [Portunus trituberculatus]|uniref:Uncharacterized protein n=1 Tax=Portunus trituberculatus TaxID=210409 RepID=A0A5B7HMZ4_PORTR|nr:hypothetical protein [Portunus trituberculatus]
MWTSGVSGWVDGRERRPACLPACLWRERREAKREARRRQGLFTSGGGVGGVVAAPASLCYLALALTCCFTYAASLTRSFTCTPWRIYYIGAIDPVLPLAALIVLVHGSMVSSCCVESVMLRLSC